MPAFFVVVASEAKQSMAATIKPVVARLDRAMQYAAPPAIDR
jgi:hypothetical protein